MSRSKSASLVDEAALIAQAAGIANRLSPSGRRFLSEALVAEERRQRTAPARASLKRTRQVAAKPIVRRRKSAAVEAPAQQ